MHSYVDLHESFFSFVFFVKGDSCECMTVQVTAWVLSFGTRSINSVFNANIFVLIK